MTYAVERLVDVFANRARHPHGLYCLHTHALSDREAAIVQAVMDTCAIELRHAIREDQWTATPHVSLVRVK